MPPEIEAIKHIGDWKDGKLICRPDCPNRTHKTDNKHTPTCDCENMSCKPDCTHDHTHKTFTCPTCTSDIEGIVDSFFNDQDSIRKIETGLTTAECKKIEKKLLNDILQSQADKYEREKGEILRAVYREKLQSRHVNSEIEVVPVGFIKTIAKTQGVDLSE